nr:hypothetical protein [Bacillus sp. SG-1]
MKIRVGVVGPEDSVTEIMKAGDHFSELNLIPYVYERTEETEGIIKRNKEFIDQWFFSGQAPYYFALSKGLITENDGSYTPLNGSSLLGTLLEAFVREKKILCKLSLDTLMMEEIEAVKDQFSLHDLSFVTNEFYGYSPADEIIQFHKRLFEDGHVEAAVTCIHSVYTALKNMGIPVYRVFQSELAVHRALGLIKERAQSTWYRKSQLVIVGIEAIYPSPSGRNNQMSFKIKHQELELHRTLLDFVEDINGSIVQMGDGLFYLYSTRGELELYTKKHSPRTLIDECYVNSNLPIRIGIGFGSTVLEAEDHVRMALDKAREEKGTVIISINEDKEVSSFSENDAPQVAYHTRESGELWQERFKDADISSQIVSKIQSLSHHYHKDTLTSQDLARWLKNTERNARRILSEMERIGVARVTGEESTGRGRPRKVYELLLEKK